MNHENRTGLIIFLVGMMGSGKTTVGRALADALCLPFYDTDEIISKENAKQISEIFESSGEEHFRRLEHHLVKSLDINEGVIATGGGLPCFHNNMEILKEKGIVFFLDVDIHTISSRIESNTNRPLVTGKSKEQIHKVIQALFFERYSTYIKAHHVIASDASIESIVGAIVALVKQ